HLVHSITIVRSCIICLSHAPFFPTCSFSILSLLPFFSFIYNDTSTTEIYTLSLHDALPICAHGKCLSDLVRTQSRRAHSVPLGTDRKSTRLNSSHLGISYAVFCLKKKNKIFY